MINALKEEFDLLNYFSHDGFVAQKKILETFSLVAACPYGILLEVAYFRIQTQDLVNDAVQQTFHFILRNYAKVRGPP